MVCGRKAFIRVSGRDGGLKRFCKKAGAFLLLAALLTISHRWRRAAFLVLLFVALDLLAFAHDFRRDFPASRFAAPELEELRSTLLSHERTADFTIANRAMTMRVPTVSGYNSRILSDRYSQMLPFLQRRDLWLNDQDKTFSHRYRFSSLLRITKIIAFAGGETKVFPVSDPPLPRAFLVDRYQVVLREQVLEAMTGLGEDLSMVAVLEQDPPLFPVPGSPGEVSVKDLSTDERLIEVTIDTPRLLILTDSYDPRWEAIPQEGSSQSLYEILPADLVLTAIPLQKGTHRILLRYSPLSWKIGASLSLGGWLLFGIGVVMTRKRKTHGG